MLPIEHVCNRKLGTSSQINLLMISNICCRNPIFKTYLPIAVNIRCISPPNRQTRATAKSTIDNICFSPAHGTHCSFLSSRRFTKWTATQTMTRRRVAPTKNRNPRGVQCVYNTHYYFTLLHTNTHTHTQNTYIYTHTHVLYVPA